MAASAARPRGGLRRTWSVSTHAGRRGSKSDAYGMAGVLIEASSSGVPGRHAPCAENRPSNKPRRDDTDRHGCRLRQQ